MAKDNGQTMDRQWMDNGWTMDGQWMDNGWTLVINTKNGYRQWIDNGWTLVINTTKWLQTMDRQWMDNGWTMDGQWMVIGNKQYIHFPMMSQCSWY